MIARSRKPIEPRPGSDRVFWPKPATIEFVDLSSLEWTEGDGSSVFVGPGGGGQSVGYAASEAFPLGG